MAINAAVIVEMLTTGATTNGGGFKTGASGTDFSQQDAAQYALTGGTSAGAGALYLHASAAAVMVGNLCHISGTNFTTGWYEIVSVVAGVSMTMDRNCTTAAGALGVCNVGGAISTFQDAFLETLTAGNTVYIKAGTYTVTETINVAKDGTGAAYITLVGYNSTRGDNPTGANRPLIDYGANTFSFDDYWGWTNLRVTGTSATGCRSDAIPIIQNCYFANTSGTANRYAYDTEGAAGALITNSEFTSTNGYACQLVSNYNGVMVVSGCYFHDSVNCVYCNSLGQLVVINCVFDTFTTNGIYSIEAYYQTIQNNTFYGGGSAQGTGVNIGGGYYCLLLNNILKNLTLGMSATALAISNIEDYNDFHGCTTNRTNINTGAHSITTDPSMTDPANADFSLSAGSGALNTAMDAFLNIL